jgi:hypothetical protein
MQPSVLENKVVFWTVANLLLCRSSLDLAEAPRTLDGLVQWFPTFFHLRTTWQPISINCIFHIRKLIVINITDVISN